MVTSFVSQGSTSDVTLKDGAIKGGGTPTSVGQRDKLDAPVAVLTSQTTASSGEQALLAFRGLDRTRVFGQATAGYASINQNFPLYTGRTMCSRRGPRRPAPASSSGRSRSPRRRDSPRAGTSSRGRMARLPVLTLERSSPLCVLVHNHSHGSLDREDEGPVRLMVDEKAEKAE